MTKAILYILLLVLLLSSSITVTANQVTVFEPPIILRDSDTTDSRAAKWITAIHALTYPHRFDSYDDWVENFGGKLAMQASEQAYNDNQFFAYRSPVQSIVYAVEYSRGGETYLTLAKTPGATTAWNSDERVGVSLYTLKFLGNRWVAIDPSEAPEKRDFIALSAAELDQKVQSGRLVLAPQPSERTSIKTDAEPGAKAEHVTIVADRAVEARNGPPSRTTVSPDTTTHLNAPAGATGEASAKTGVNFVSVTTLAVIVIGLLTAGTCLVWRRKP